MARTLHYTILDVFAEQALEGNPLAVFHDGRSLSDDEMQALARELNLAETTFVRPNDDPELDRAQGVRVRIFTTEEELPFAGHPTMGTSSWVYFNHAALAGARSMTLRLNVGPIEVTFDERAAGEEGVRATMQQKDPVFGAKPDRAEVARAIDLAQDDLFEGYAPQIVSTGMPFCIVALRSLEALGRLAMVQTTAQPWLAANAAKFFYCIAPTGKSTAPQWRARMQFCGREDPATGSAAGCCIAWLLQAGLAASGVAVEIEQGIEMMRPSRITASALLVDGAVKDVRVSGRTIPVARGSFFLP
jgi:trans-2,3-dihydro-3-hydroxyanthranilate isomerase